MPSTIHPVRQALIAAIGALPELAGVKVSYGPPIPIPHQFVWIGDATATQAAAALGKRRRDERYDLECRCSVVRQGNDAEAAAGLAHGYVAAIEDYLRANPTLPGYAGDGQLIDVNFVGIQSDELGDDKARESLITFRVGVHARI
jgi:hypothetical protein